MLANFPSQQPQILSQASNYPLQSVLPIQLFYNYPSLSINIVKLLPSITPSLVSRNALTKYNQSQFSQKESEI